MKLFANLIALTALAIPTLLTDATASPTTTLAGTTWSGYDSTGESVTYSFAPEGTLAYATSKGSWRDGTWKQQGDAVTFEVNNAFATYRGEIRGDSIEGTASNKNHFSWTWKVSQRSDTAAQKSTIRPNDRTDGPQNRDGSTRAATPGSERFVIKGLRLGAGPSTALEFLKANSFAPSKPPHQRSLAGKTSIQTISYVDSQEYRNRKTGLAEAILTLEFTPPFPGSSGVVSVVHSIQYSTKYGEGLSKEQVLADLQTKYGKPDSISPKSNDALAPTWTVAGTNYDCNLQATIIPPANAGEPGELQLWAFDKPLYWRAEKMAKEHIDRVDAQRPKDTTRPDF